jgi:hypothetical protein
MRFRRYLVGVSGFLLLLRLPVPGSTIGTNGHPLPQRLYTTGGTKAFETSSEPAGPRAAAISADGNTIVLGAPYDSSAITNAGAVYVFVRTGGAWVLQQKLTAGDSGTNHYFGTAVAIEGNRIVVGADNAFVARSTGNVEARGAVYVFTGNGMQWTQEQRLVPGTPLYGLSEFGTSVAISGETIVVGAPDVQAAYIFGRAGATWAEQQRLVPGVTGCGEWFGVAVSIDGDTLIVGAPHYGADGDEQTCGAAYVFRRNGANWIEQQRLTGNTNVIQTEWGVLRTHFGASVTLDGDMAVVGAPLESSGPEQEDWFKGAAYVFLRPGPAENWSLQQKLMPPELVRDDAFGHSLALSGDTLAIGLRAFTVNFPNAGEVQLFQRGGTNWQRTQRLRATDLADRDYFGRALALSSTGTLAARSYTTNETTYVYELDGSAWNPWRSIDIGAVSASGNGDFSNGTFRVTGSGEDIWGTKDEFHFTYRALTGNGEIRARVVSIQNTDPWAKAGVMFADRLDATSRKAMAFVTPVNGSGFQWRSTPAGSSQFTAATPFAGAPLWLRLVRSNNTFRSYHSPDGVVWRQIDQQFLGMTNIVYAGLAVTSHRDGTLCTAVFDNVTTRDANDPPPTVTVEPAQSTAEGGTSSGFFNIRRSGGDLSAPLTVFFSFTGTARFTDDFGYAGSAEPKYGTNTGPWITISAWRTGTQILIQPVDDNAREGPETVVLTYTPDASYIIGSSNGATITIADNEPPLPSISSMSRESDGSFRMTIHGEIGRTYTLSASGDLINWTPVDTWTSQASTMIVEDPQAATLPRRFYRVAETP